MRINGTLNLFYDEPDPDRYLPFDRYPRRALRRVVRGRPRPGGQRRVFLNLRAGLDRLGVSYRVNDYRHAIRHEDEPVCIVGKAHLLDARPWRNPIYFGAAVFSHPVDDPNLFERLPVRRMLVPGEWMRRMCEPYFGDRVVAWPVGIDTDLWAPHEQGDPLRDIDVLVYDKIMWDRDEAVPKVLNPVLETLSHHGLITACLRYGSYREGDYRQLLSRTRAMVFLCEHETQGLAYQQALSCGVPILAWNRGGCWADPDYYPHRVRFGPVSSVPYWDGRCGATFADPAEFSCRFEQFWEDVRAGAYEPRTYILENLTLEGCALKYLQLVGASDQISALAAAIGATA